MTFNFPAAFPESDAGIVRKAANLSYHQPALDALDLVRDMIGHPENIKRSVDGWKVCLKVMNESFGGISQAHSQVLTRWTGGAATSFAGTAADMKLIVGGNVLALQGIIASTMEIYGAVMDAYKEGVTFISKCAQSLLDLGGGLLSDWEAVLGVAAAGPTQGASLALVAGHFTDLLSKFADNITNLINAAISTTATYNIALNKAMAQIYSIKPIPGPVSGIVDMSAWKPA